jgi:hypothetical protein
MTDSFGAKYSSNRRHPVLLPLAIAMPDDQTPQSSIILYQTEDGRTRIQCRFEDETIWLTQALIAELFQTSIPNINLHLKAIYAEGELSEAATIKSYLIVRPEGGRQVSREVLHYSLPAILAVGYRVRSPRGTQFRQWATAREPHRRHVPRFRRSEEHQAVEAINAHLPDLLQDVQ